jgi:uncharacterized cofD-like protein
MPPKQKPAESLFKRLMRNELRWLTPGLGVKRWILLILVGTTLIGLGLAVILIDFYRSAPEGWLADAVAAVALQPLDRPLRFIIFGSLGLLFVGLGIWRLNRSLMRPFMRPGKPILDEVSNYRRRGRGPHIVVIGGGTGLSALLRGLKNHTANLTAIVTVADDGGSSGELRRTIGVLPPGDLRNCLTALSNDEQLLSQIFQYRFSTGGSGLEGHNLGNLFITALADITGSFEEAVAESGRVLAVQGRVLPSTLHDVRLVADVHLVAEDRDVQVKGESQIPKMGGQVRSVWLEPDNPLAYPPAIQALLTADLILIGPGSLYTSILPNLLVPDLAAAVRASRAVKFFICNVTTQPGETDDYSCGDHVRTIEKHLGGPLFDLVVCNQRFEGKLPAGQSWIKPEPGLEENYAIYMANLIDPTTPWRHDSAALGQAVMDLFNERTGPLINKPDSNN